MCAVIVMAPGVVAALPPRVIGADAAAVEAHVGCRTAGASDPLNRNVPRIPCRGIGWSWSCYCRFLNTLATVSVPTFKVMLPAGAAPSVSARMTALARASVCAVIVMVAGVLAEVPPLIPVAIVLWSRLTLVAGLPEPVTP